MITHTVRAHTSDTLMFFSYLRVGECFVLRETIEGGKLYPLLRGVWIKSDRNRAQLLDDDSQRKTMSLEERVYRVTLSVECAIPVPEVDLVV